MSVIVVRDGVEHTTCAVCGTLKPRAELLVAATRVFFPPAGRHIAVRAYYCGLGCLEQRDVPTVAEAAELRDNFGGELR